MHASRAVNDVSATLSPPLSGCLTELRRVPIDAQWYLSWLKSDQGCLLRQRHVNCVSPFRTLGGILSGGTSTTVTEEAEHAHKIR